MKNLFTIITLSLLYANVTFADEYKVDIKSSRTESAYINLDNGDAEIVANDNWDIAFITGFQAAVHINGGAGVQLWHVTDGSIDDFDAPLDTAGKFEIWDQLNNSTATWNIGAFNLGKNGFEGSTGDFGWGQYSQTIVTGSELFVIQLRNGEYKKFAIDELASGIYYFQYSDLNNENVVYTDITKSHYNGKMFGYYDLQNGVALDREPFSSDWHIEYSKYIEPIPVGPNEYLPYPVVGIRTNRNLKVAQLDEVDIVDTPLPKEGDYDYAINAIGHDWKEFDFSTNGYVIAENRVYFVQEYAIDNSGTEPVEVPVGDLYKIVFKEFVGGETTFDLTKVEPSITSVESEGHNKFAITPNIVDKNEKINLVYAGNNLNNAQLNIFSADGNLVQTTNVVLSNGLQVTNINTSNLSSGVYFVRINSNNAIYTQKFIVK